ncbi:hypothetical protein [Streptomyces diastatochromogenes]|uniref:hypothetical protein n=1 Tax=Streptomyces diastatochromogenes TaxID=42236 RepID=UPI000D1AA7CB|nr:hypothetical protein [Streptomyces diastatochromogenes]
MLGIATGGLHSPAISGQGDVLAWGWSKFGQLGDGTNNDGNTAVTAPSPSSPVRRSD